MADNPFSPIFSAAFGAGALPVDPFSPAFSSAFGSGPTGWVSFPPTATLSATITNLAANATYDFQVFAVNAKGPGPPSPVLTVKT